METLNVNSISLRPYQEKCVEKIQSILDFTCPVNCYCLVLPTGAGKSVIIGAAISHIIKNYEVSELSILVCSWSKKIIKQDKDKVFADADRDYWMTADEALEYGMIDKILTK